LESIPATISALMLQERGVGFSKMVAAAPRLLRSRNSDGTFNLFAPTSCARRFFATPLHEIILRGLAATALAKAKENSIFRDHKKPDMARGN
jgi:hypothetical protein